jgi:hypothetical protein
MMKAQSRPQIPLGSGESRSGKKILCPAMDVRVRFPLSAHNPFFKAYLKNRYEKPHRSTSLRFGACRVHR